VEKYLCVPKGSAVRAPAMTPTELASFTQHEVGLGEIKKSCILEGKYSILEAEYANLGQILYT